jgi:2',3'-cyclic-nucleotide 2'-phosphodiesterase (5'-nucleotidase family)
VPRIQGLVAAAFAASLTLVGPSAAETVEVTFLLVNDVDQMAEVDGRGGYPRIVAAIEAERAARDNVVFVHAGDAISPSLLSGFDQGAHIINLMNMARPDVFVPGNHEYDFGPDIFRNRMAEAEFPLLAANLRDAADQPLPGFRDTVMLEFGGVKVGVVGLTADDAYVKSSPGDLKIAPTVATGIAQAEQLRQAGANVVVAVAHSDRATDRQLFDSRAFDLILSGDDHDLLIRFDGRTALVESLAQGVVVAAVDLTIETTEEDGKIATQWWPSFRAIDTAGVEPDPEVAERVAAYQAEFSKELDMAIGVTATGLDSRRTVVRQQEAAIGNLIADAMRATVGADIGLMNSGGIRGDKLYSPGMEITRKDILTELPFGNRLVKLEVTGEVLRQALEHSLSRYEEGAGRFLQLSGAAIEADPSAPTGKRVKSVVVNGEALDPKRTYTLAISDFNADGGDGFDMLTDAPRVLTERDGPLLAAAVMAHIRKLGEVAPAVEGRIKLAQ